MNRIFHARVPWHTFFLLLLLLIIALWSYWERSGILAALSLLLMVVLVERSIHTSYTVTTDGMLLISRGRFSKLFSIPLLDIHRIEQVRRVRLGSFCLNSYLLVYYGSSPGEEKVVSLIPSNEEELVTYIQKLRKK